MFNIMQKDGYIIVDFGSVAVKYYDKDLHLMLSIWGEDFNRSKKKSIDLTLLPIEDDTSTISISRGEVSRLRRELKKILW